jgi:hypothetical protein
MNRLFVLVAAATAGLALAGVAQAGCMATVALSSTPKVGQAAGVPWAVTIRVLQHGRTPMPDAKPEVRIRDRAGRLVVFKGKPMARIGSYRAQVVFPRAGRYSINVYDGFPVEECARVHTFKSVVVVDV